MDILDILKIISVVYTLVVIWYGWSRISDHKTKVLFGAMLVCFLLSAVLFFPEGAMSEWAKHSLFYLGQVLFYFFLNRLIAKRITTPARPTSALPTLAAAGAPVEWFTFITDLGLQHIITLPFLFLIITFIRIQYSFVSSSAIKPMLNIFMLAGFFLTMIHVGEFVVESLGLFPMLEGNPIEITEFFWFYMAMGTYWYAISLLPRSASQPEKATSVSGTSLV